MRDDETRKGEAPADYVPELRDVSLHDFATAQRKPIAFAVERILPRGTTTLLGGHGGSLKSTVALAAVLHWVCGLAFAGFAPEHALRILFVSLEDPADVIIDRLRKIADEFALDAVSIAANLRILDGSDSDGALAFELNVSGVREVRFTALMEEVEDAALGRDVILIDGASDAFAGDENSRRQVRAFLRKLSQVAKVANAANLLVTHIDKQAAKHGANGQHYSGSTAWHNSARGRLALLLDGDKLTLRHEKSNYGPRADDVTIRVTANGVPVPVTGAAAAAQQADDVLAALRLVRAATRDRIVVPCATTGQFTAWHVLNHLPEAAPFSDRADKRRLDAALGLAARAGRIIRATYKTDQRKTRDCWELTEAGAALAQIDASPASIKPPEAARANPPHTPPNGAWARAGGARTRAPMGSNGASAHIGASAHEVDMRRHSQCETCETGANRTGSHTGTSRPR